MPVGVLNLHLDSIRRREPGRHVNIVSDRMLRIKGSAEHSRWTCVDRPSCPVYEKLHNNARHTKCLRKRDCLRQRACFLLNQAWHFPVQC